MFGGFSAPDIVSRIRVFLAMIYVDVSHLIEYVTRRKTLSGIQRVTFNSVLELHRVAGPGTICALCYDPKTSTFLTAEVSTLADFVMATYGANKGTAVLDANWNSAAFSKDDTLFFSEWFWNEALLQAAGKLSRDTGVKIVTFIHDAAPTMVPEIFGAASVAQFNRRLSIAVGISDKILTNSHSSKHDILRSFDILKLKPVEVEVATLPHEFVGQLELLERHSGQLLTRDANQKNLSRQIVAPFVLCVGTIENKKNVLRLIQVWAQLSKQHGAKMPRLVFVGRHGWQTVRLRALIFWQQHIMRRIVVLGHCDDAMLQRLYQACLFTVYVSLYEGWGLPVGESLWFGKPVVSSNATSMPEVGGDMVSYVDPKDTNEIATAVEKMCFDDGYRQNSAQHINKARLLTWQAFGAKLYHLLISA